MALSPRAELLALQKQLFKRNQEVIGSSITVDERGFNRYELVYRKHVKVYQKKSTKIEMQKAINSSEIIYVGDYHTCNQSQRSFLRILRTTVEQNPKLVVCLELLHARHQENLDRYLSGKITEKTFLQRIKLKEHWVFDLWNNFKPIFDFCKYHQIPMVAADSAPVGSNIKKRDKYSGELIANVCKTFPERKVFVLIGDLHIAPPHLPKDVQQALRKQRLKRKHLILYQNSEEIYWNLAKKRNGERVEVVKINQDSFCRMHTPPVVCQQSYINWLEHDEGEIDYADARHSFLEIVDNICAFLQLKIPKSRREAIEVFTSGDLSFLRRLKETKVFSKHELALIKEQILSSESYYIAKAHFVYLANLSLNHAAEEATHFIKHLCSGDEEPRDLIDAFYANILHEALGFFGSKIINHKRKCSHERDYKKLAKYFASTKVPAERILENEAVQVILKYLKHEKTGEPLRQADFFHMRMDLFLAVTHAIGYMLGEKIYYGLIDGVVDKKTIRRFFRDPWSEEDDPFHAYSALKTKLAKVKIPRRM